MQLLASLVLLCSAVQAGPFTHRASQGEWVQREVEREYTLPKGWLQIQLEADSKGSRAARDSSGALAPWAEGTRWRYSRLWLNIDQGFSQRVRIYAHIPLVHAWLRSSAGADTSTVAMGDVHTGLWVQPWLEGPWASALQLDLKAPSGVEWPSDLIGGSANTGGFLTGTGITNLGAHLHLRRRFGDVAAVKAQLGYVRKFPAVVGYIVEDGGFANGWLNAGDELAAGLEAQAQLADSWAVSGQARYSHRGVYQLGVSGQSPSALELDAIPGSAGDFVDVGLDLGFSPSDGLEFGLGASAQVVGSDTRLFAHLGLEEFSPQPGVSVSLRGAYRW